MIVLSPQSVSLKALGTKYGNAQGNYADFWHCKIGLAPLIPRKSLEIPRHPQGIPRGSLDRNIW